MRTRELQKGEPAMSYCNKHEHSAHLAPGDREKRVFHALASAELKTHGISAEAYIRDLKAELAPAKRRSSAALLRKKLSAPLVRELHEI